MCGASGQPWLRRSVPAEVGRRAEQEGVRTGDG